MLKLLLSLALPMVINIGTINSNNAYFDNEEVKETEVNDNNALLLSSTGLVAIGGAGSAIIVYNSKRRKENTPSKEINYNEEEVE